MLALRKTLFYLFIIIYLVLCPLIVLDSLGINIDLGKQKIISATGLISISTIPQGAEITINGKHFRKKSPALVHDLPPGQYTIEITLDNYKTWQKTISIEKAQATALEDVLLIPVKWQSQAMTNRSFDRLIATENNSFFLLQQGPNLKNLSIYKFKENFLHQISTINESPSKENKQPQQIFSSDSEYSEQKLTALTTMPQSPFVLIQSRIKNLPCYLWMDTSSDEFKPTDITPLFVNSPENIRWEKDDPENIFYLSENKLSILNTMKKSTTADLTSAIKSYGLFNKQVFSINDQNQFASLDYLNKTSKLLIGTLPQLPVEFQKDEHYIVQLFSENLILFQSDAGQLLSNKVPYVLVPKNVVGFSKQLVNNQLLIWTKEKLGIVNFNKTNKEGVFEMGPDVHWLPVTGKDIRQAFWVNKDSHILYLDRNQIKIVETNANTESSIDDITKTDSELVYDDVSGKLFYLDQQTHQLMSLTILPDHEFIAFMLPKNIQKKDIR
jgi:hypothetical protein